MSYLKLVRLPNLLMIALTMIFVKYGLIAKAEFSTALTNIDFMLLVLSTLCIAAGGNIINDIYDIDIDRINKPNKILIGKKISSKAAHRLFFALNIIGVGIGFYLSNSIGKPALAAIFVFISLLLFIYSSYLKSVLLIGNILISILVAMSIIIINAFDLVPISTGIIDSPSTSLPKVMNIVTHYAIFALVLNFIREIVKDLQDINGDKNGGMNTLPIAVGRNRATMFVFTLGVFTIAGIIYYMYVYLYNDQLIILYFLIMIIAPLLYFCVKAWGAESTKDYAFLSKILKVVMLLGMSSILFYPLF